MKTVQTGTVFIGVLLAVTAPGFSDAQEPKVTVKKEAPTAEPEPQVTTEQAIRAAVDHVPGRVHELEVVHKQGKLVWAIEVITLEGRHMLVDVDGATGAVTHTEEKSLQKLAGDPTKGKVVFEKHCLSCHGEDGKGTGTMGPLLNPPAADYTSESSRANRMRNCFTRSRKVGQGRRCVVSKDGCLNKKCGMCSPMCGY